MSAPFDLIVRGGTLVTETSVQLVDLAIRHGRIAALLAPGEGARANDELDATNLMVLPGLVDQHAHFCEPGRTDWEGFRSGSASAAAGGVTTVVDMPLDSLPPVTSVEAFQEKLATVEGQSLVDFALWGGLIEDNVAAIADLVAAGAVGCKAFMTRSSLDDYHMVGDRILLEGMKELGRLGSILAIHAENDDMTRRAADEFRAAGRDDAQAYAMSRPPLAELEAIERGIFLARDAGSATRVHFVHTSVAEGVLAVASARRRGQRVTVETCPHYLTLDEDAFLAIGPEAKCAPPLRPRRLVEDLWRCVLDGLVDSIASDHSPCPPAEKLRGANDMWQAWGGITGIETMLPLLLSEGVHHRGLSLTLLVRMIAGNPARKVGLWPRKGHLGIGADADIALVALDRSWTLERGMLHTRHRASPFIGRRFKGAVVETLVRGLTVFRDGEIVAKPGHGLHLRAAASDRDA